MKNVMRWFVFAAVLACVAWLVATNVHAQAPRPCAEDVEKFCKDVQPGGGRIAECLKQHEKELSGPCRQEMQEARERVKEVHQACADDVHTFCGDVIPGKGRVARCLKEHANQLSPECKKELEDAKKRSGKSLPEKQ
jgi:exonuclease VII small subunit